jgi:hypothetical protein
MESYMYGALFCFLLFSIRKSYGIAVRKID